MKTFLIVIGTIVAVFVLLIGGISLFLYLKMDDLAIQGTDIAIEEFIKKNTPSDNIKNELLRFSNNLKIINSQSSSILAGELVESLEDNIVDEKDLKFIKNVSDVVESGEKIDFKKARELLDFNFHKNAKKILNHQHDRDKGMTLEFNTQASILLFIKNNNVPGYTADVLNKFSRTMQMVNYQNKFVLSDILKKSFQDKLVDENELAFLTELSLITQSSATTYISDILNKYFWNGYSYLKQTLDCPIAKDLNPICVNGSSSEHAWWYVRVSGTDEEWKQGSNAQCATAKPHANYKVGDATNWGQASCMSAVSQVECQKILANLGCF
ncbi:MAG: hypothetical protein V4629_13190 [Pseudomonadota bacterium]